MTCPTAIAAVAVALVILEKVGHQGLQPGLLHFKDLSTDLHLRPSDHFVSGMGHPGSA